MASSSSFFSLFVIVALATATTASLSPTFYQRICPQALPTIKKLVEDAVKREPRMGASLLRLHFHDCFVNGCDASILLDDVGNFVGEKTANANNNSARGFEVVHKIKSKVDKVCRGAVVSCADILAVAARDSVVALGGPTWEVPLGRRDSTTASRATANNNIPAPFLDLPALIDNFKKQGLNTRDLVALSGGHTLGFSQCRNFRARLYNESNIDLGFARSLQSSCPRSGGDTNLVGLDSTPAFFDVNYFKALVQKKGLLHSDQVLYNGGSTDALVKIYRLSHTSFSKDFVNSMVKMGNIKPLTGKKGQIRNNCRRPN